MPVEQKPLKQSKLLHFAKPLPSTVAPPKRSHRVHESDHESEVDATDAAVDDASPRPLKRAKTASKPKPVPKPKLKAKPKASDDDRSLEDVMLCIKPEFTKLIAERKKNHEYRKYKLKDSVKHLWLYETAPTSAITYVRLLLLTPNDALDICCPLHAFPSTGRSIPPHLFTICDTALVLLNRHPFLTLFISLSYVMSTTEPKVPGEVNDPTGVGNDDFDQGLKESKYGYPVIELYKLKTPLTTSQLKARFDIATPQGWRYATRKLVEKLPLAEMEKVF